MASVPRLSRSGIGRNFGAPRGSCGYYINSLGHAVPRPCGDWHQQAPPSDATERCRDATYSYSEHPFAPGTCSHHGGVVRYLRRRNEPGAQPALGDFVNACHLLRDYTATTLGMVQNVRVAHANVPARSDLAHAPGVEAPSCK